MKKRDIMLKNIYPILILFLLVSGCLSSAGRAECCEEKMECVFTGLGPYPTEYTVVGPLEGYYGASSNWIGCCKPIESDKTRADCKAQYPEKCGSGLCSIRLSKGRECGASAMDITKKCVNTNG